MNILTIRSSAGLYIAYEDTLNESIVLAEPLGFGDTEFEAREDLMDKLQREELLTYHEIKLEWADHLCRDSLQVYIKSYFTPVYDAELEFLGFERNIHV